MITRSNLRCLLASALASTLMLQASISYADDTEIFFGGATIDKSIQPNVLFILDNSGSMADPSEPKGKAKMVQMKSAFSDIISSAGNINVGVMTMNGANPRLLSPVQDINKSINVSKLTTPALIDSGDDASYNNATAATTITDPALVMGYVRNVNNAGTTVNSVTRALGSDATVYPTEYSSYYVYRTGNVDYACSARITTAGTKCPAGGKTEVNASTTSTVGNDGLLLFRNLNIPAGVTITSAKLILTPVNAALNSGKAPGFYVSLENTKTAAAFNSDTSIATRSFPTSLRTTIANNGTLVGGEVVLELKTALTALAASAPAANPLADISMRVRGSGTTSYPWKIGDNAANSPRLEVTWTGNENSTRTTGLRFQNVAIPKGATIVSARIDFVPAASDNRDVTFTVSGENVSNSAAFTATENFTTRSKVSASMSWSPSAWKTEAPQVSIEGPVVTDVVQSVIDSAADWCGNNAMAFYFTPTAGQGSRTAFGVDAANGLQPVLNVKYTGGDSGCLNPILNISIVDPKDDATQDKTGDSAVLTTKPMVFTSNFIGARYLQVPVLQGATVMEAALVATPNNTTPGTTSVSFENEDTSGAFNALENDISKRKLTSGAASCTFTPTAAGVPVTCNATAIKTQLQSIFSRSGWKDGNALAVILQPTSGNFALRARDTSADVSLKLRVKIAWKGLGSDSYTVRDYTNGVVQALNASGGTPIVPTLHDAARYMVQNPAQHTSASASPMTSACQANYVVFLTDGEANGTDTTSTSGIASMTGKTCSDDATASSEKCARTLVGWMATEDMANFEGVNSIKTSTIGFDLSDTSASTKLLKDLASLGGGKFYPATNASDLTNAFDDIVQSALATNTSFVNSSAPINSFERSENIDQLYYSLFRPSENDRWAGNLKRYRLKTVGDVATVVDANGTAAVDTNTGFFSKTSRSYWNTFQDGDDIAAGGAASKLALPADRTLYTLTGTQTNGTAKALESLVASNTGITKTKLGDPDMTDDTRANLISYIRGGPDGTGTAPRYALGDPIHSSPRLVNYGCSTYTDGVCTKPDIMAVTGSNEGYVQGFDTDTGEEKFGFMPQELLPNIRFLRANAKSTSLKPRVYGLDNPVVIWTNDINRNGVIYGDPSATPPTTSGLNTGEFVYAYVTMGRGGRNIYALDITNRTAPKLLWVIKGGSTTGFEKLGQTWSEPTRAKINVGGTVTDVLIFGGGYDVDQDKLNETNSVTTTDDLGNAIYIVNAKTGELIWSASNSGSPSLTLSNMNYSIPSSIRTLDLQESGGKLIADPNGLTDQFFVGDMGGQIWRFYINNGSSGSGLVTAGGTGENGLFATLGGTTPANARRFYKEPDVSILNLNGNRSLAVTIGSGYRGHPLNETIRDRIYALRTATLFKSANEGTLTESNLYDASANYVQTGSDAQKAEANTAFARTTGGWYVRLGTTGQKVVSKSLTLDDIVYINTYEPSANQTGCKASVGKNRSWAMRLANATPASVAANGNGTPDDRWEPSNSGGIAGDPQVFCNAEYCWVLPDLGVPPKKTKVPPLGKTYWIDKSSLD